ncbi:hypothetical protein FIM04_03245 [SAR202 cluster bacterium AC-409-J13_OGT_754m]|nr:hypothetical protein [SAR202 cluster bacterium AC-409-J13_OGT_754m]
MDPDPTPIGSFEWSQIGHLLHFLWYYFAVVIAFGFMFLTAHAVIPSLLSTREISPTLNLARFSLYVSAFGLFIGAILLFAYMISLTSVVESFHHRYWF